MDRRIVSRIGLGFGIALLVSALASSLLVGSGAASVQAALGLAGIAFFFATNKGSMGRTFSGRATWFYGFTAVTTVVLLGILVAANYVAARKKVSWDLTKSGIYTLAEDTVKTLAGLQEEVKVTAFYGPADPEYPGLRDLLDRYKAKSDKLSVEYVDPYSNPQLVEQKGIRVGGPRVIFARGTTEARATEISEEALTNALVKVLRSGEKKLYATTGHGERDLADGSERGYAHAAKGLADEGLEVQKLALTQGEIPADAAALLILAPEKPFFEPEIAALRGFLEKGGRLLVSLEPGFSDPALQKLLEDYGLIFDEALVVDPLSRLMGGGAAIPVVQTYAQHEISKEFQLATMFPTARPITARGDSTPRATILALSNPSAWGETNLEDPQARYDEGEKRGQLGLAAVVSKPAGDKETRIVAFGDADFASNQYESAAGNRDLFLNSVNWLASQEARITIRPRTREGSRLVLTENDARFLNLFSINVLPMLVLGAGLSVWLVRRSK